MGDVEEMIGELEDEDTDEETPKKEARSKKDAEEEESSFGLDLDSAWSSPDEDR